ncbi:hypothetical protein G2W53_041788 [Senna tora]|uniref:Uncharacterized protein n=1 Tax=Senna tora TaxID=362788 RepID=A0A834SFW8_9FABA|nr:hypothetical protein G2W53_041788 [Senna tora]
MATVMGFVVSPFPVMNSDIKLRCQVQNQSLNAGASLRVDRKKGNKSVFKTGNKWRKEGKVSGVEEKKRGTKSEELEALWDDGDSDSAILLWGSQGYYYINMISDEVEGGSKSERKVATKNEASALIKKDGRKFIEPQAKEDLRQTSTSFLSRQTGRNQALISSCRKIVFLVRTGSLLYRSCEVGISQCNARKSLEWGKLHLWVF